MVQSDKIRVDFVCVHNAGRSQMAAAFAERERGERDLEDVVEIHSGGTNPAETVHDEVVEAMDEIGIDIADRSPKYVADLDQLEESNYLVTMGCSIAKFNPDHYAGETLSWDLTNPDGQDVETVRAVRDEIEDKVESLFDDIERVAEETQVEDSAGGVVTAIRNVLSR